MSSNEVRKNHQTQFWITRVITSENDIDFIHMRLSLMLVTAQSAVMRCAVLRDLHLPAWWWSLLEIYRSYEEGMAPVATRLFN
ncbi:Fibronectin type III fold [Echinococcus multilocularis]|uniref:Fibronectin type III fold n=1 Tax=Echinococcus multilocularis TaxID=6211 RepID=A0A068Y0G9_ECHMU|nr:Fibronectin type III fold [Echinococcus multilocularis]